MDYRRYLVLIRHGATEWSELGRMTSTTDVELTESGRAACDEMRLAMAAPLAAMKSVEVYSSPSRRAVETASQIFPGLSIVEESALREVAYGSYEGRSREDLRLATGGWNYWIDGALGGEDPTSAVARATGMIARWRASAAELTAMVTHGQFVQALVGVALSIPQAHWAAFRPPSGSMGLIGDDPLEGCVLLAWGSRTWRADGIGA